MSSQSSLPTRNTKRLLDDFGDILLAPNYSLRRIPEQQVSDLKKLCLEEHKRLSRVNFNAFNWSSPSNQQQADLKSQIVCHYYLNDFCRQQLTSLNNKYNLLEEEKSQLTSKHSALADQSEVSKIMKMVDSGLLAKLTRDQIFPAMCFAFTQVSPSHA